MKRYLLFWAAAATAWLVIMAGIYIIACEIVHTFATVVHAVFFP